MILFRKKQNTNTELDQLSAKGILTEEEVLKLKKDRAENDLKNYLSKQKNKK